MANSKANLGDDLMIDTDDDLTFNLDGDLLFCSDIEKIDVNNRFTGYIAVREWLHDLIKTVIGVMPFDLTFGSNINYYEGSSIELVERVAREELPSQILKDTRFRSVDSVTTIYRSDSQVDILIKVTTVNNQEPQEFVFPFLIN